MTIDVIIPHIGNQAFLNQCLDLYKNTSNPALTNVIVVDNGSKIPLENNICGSVKRFDENLGMLQTLIQAKKFSTADILVYTHSDMFIYEKNWDERLVHEFTANPKLGLAGTVGASISSSNGGRANVYCSFRNAEAHGFRTPKGGIFVSQLDGCCMIFRRKALDSFEIDERFFPHHFYDKDWSLELLIRGWNIKVLDLDCEHLGGIVTIGDPENTYQLWATEYLKQRGIQTTAHGDYYFHQANEKIFLEKWHGWLSLRVDHEGAVHRE